MFFNNHLSALDLFASRIIALAGNSPWIETTGFLVTTAAFITALICFAGMILRSPSLKRIFGASVMYTLVFLVAMHVYKDHQSWFLTGMMLMIFNFLVMAFRAIAGFRIVRASAQ